MGTKFNLAGWHAHVCTIAPLHNLVHFLTQLILCTHNTLHTHLSEHLWQLLQHLLCRLVLAKHGWHGLLDVADDEHVDAQRTQPLHKLIHLQVGWGVVGRVAAGWGVWDWRQGCADMPHTRGMLHTTGTCIPHANHNLRTYMHINLSLTHSFHPTNTYALPITNHPPSGRSCVKVFHTGHAAAGPALPGTAPHSGGSWLH